MEQCEIFRWDFCFDFAMDFWRLFVVRGWGLDCNRVRGSTCLLGRCKELDGVVYRYELLILGMLRIICFVCDLLSAILVIGSVWG